MFPPRAMSALALTPLLLADPCAPAPEITFTAEDLPGSCAELHAAGGPTRDGEGVGSDGATWGSIQEALSAAPQGATLRLSPGSYCVNLAIPPRAVTLVGAGRELTILDGSGCGGDPRVAPCSVLRVVDPVGAEDAGAPTVEGVAITGGLGSSGALFTAGHDRVQGGGVLITTAPLTLRDSRVHGNHAEDEGGGLLATHVGLTLEEVIVEDNEAGEVGGGIRVYSDAHLQITGGALLGNLAGFGGGASISHSSADLVGVRILGNRAVNGGGLRAEWGTVTVTDSAIEDNVAETYGGGIMHSYEALTLKDTALRRNVAGRDGGALRTYTTALTARRLTLQANRAEESGGAATLISGEAELLNVAVIDNTAGARGGGIYNSDAALSLRFATLMGNRGAIGGGVYNFGTSAAIADSVVAYNLAPQAPNLFYGQVSAHTLLFDLGSGGAGVEAVEGSEAALIGEPRFYDDPTDQEQEGDDPHLRPGSPAIDAADPQGRCLDREDRPAPCLDRDGSPPDLGAYGGPASAESDADADGLPDLWEAARGLSPADADDAASDLDADGLTALQEYAAGTDPAQADHDGDGLLDGAEVAAGTDPRDPTDPGPHGAEGEPRTLYVPQDQPSIAAAVAAAGPMTTLKVGPGTWPAAVDLGLKGLILIGVEGSGATTLVGAGADPTIRLEQAPAGSRITGFTFTRGEGQARALELSHSTAWIADLDIRDHRSPGDGGAILASYSALSGEDLHLSGDLALSRGGALALDYSQASLTDVTVEGCAAYYGSGGIFAYHAALSLSDFTVAGNALLLENQHAGGLGLFYSQATLSQGLIQDNDAGWGGGLSIATDQDVQLVDVRILDNHASVEGGGLMMTGGDLDLIGGEVAGNDSGESGGGISIDLEARPESRVYMQGTPVERNTSGGRGGGLALRGATITLDGVGIRANAAVQGGGLAWWRNYTQPQTLAPGTFTDVTLEDNAADEGGGLYTEGIKGSLAGLRITGNLASARGGGAAVHQGDLWDLRATGNQAARGGGAYAEASSLTDLTLTGNLAEDDGGGLYSAEGLTLRRALVAGNVAGDLGGGLSTQPGALDIDGLAAVGNTARVGGGAYLYQQEGSVIGAALVANVATGGVGGGLYVDSGAPTLSGLILANNQGGASWNDAYVKGGEHAMDHSVAQGGTGDLIPGEGLVRADPQLLVAPAPGQWEGADLHLALTSPAVDLWDGGAPDADGSPRDAGIYGGPEGTWWDVDGDGLPAYFWPGSWEAPPEGYEAGDYDADDWGGWEE